MRENGADDENKPFVTLLHVYTVRMSRPVRAAPDRTGPACGNPIRDRCIMKKSKSLVYQADGDAPHDT